MKRDISTSVGAEICISMVRADVALLRLGIKTLACDVKGMRPQSSVLTVGRTLVVRRPRVQERISLGGHSPREWTFTPPQP